jgi:hypothetical protein
LATLDRALADSPVDPRGDVDAGRIRFALDYERLRPREIQIERPTIPARIRVTMAAAAVALPVGRSRARSALARAGGSFTSFMRASSPAAKSPIVLAWRKHR